MAKILHVTECHDGGVSRAIRKLVELTSQHSHYLLIHGSDAESPPSALETKRFQSAGTLGRTFELKKAVSDLQPDFVHLHSSWAGAYGRLIRLGPKIIYQPHCYKFDDPNLARPKRWLYKFAEKILSFRSNATVVLSPHERNLSLGLNSNAQCFYVPNVPSCGASTPSQNVTDGSLRDAKCVIMVGRICSQKDPSFYGEVARLAGTNPTLRNWVFRWVGDGETEFKHALEAEGVKVSGWKSGVELLSELDAADYYVHSAAYEGFPISILDAAARGLPVIARAIDALVGSEAYLVATPADVVNALEKAELEDGFRSMLSSRSSSMLDTRNEKNQENAWLDVYSNLEG